MPSGDAQVRKSFADLFGFEVVNLLGLMRNSPLLMAHDLFRESAACGARGGDDPSVELILQVGTNLAFGP